MRSLKASGMIFVKEIDLIKTYCDFSDKNSVYVILGIARKKNNNLTNSQEIVYREVIKKEKEISRKYNKIKSLIKGQPEYNFYIYITVNPRSIVKAYFRLKKQMIVWDKEVFGGVDISEHLKKIDGRWISCLMKECCKNGRTKFLFDFDCKCDIKTKKFEELLKKHTTIIWFKETRNGYHIVTEPFNFKLLLEEKDYKQFENIVELKKDSLLFVEYIGK